MSNSELIGSSTEFRSVFESVCLVAPMDSAVLIQGETGTGKGSDRTSGSCAQFLAQQSFRVSQLQRSDSRDSRNSRRFMSSGAAIYRRHHLFSWAWKWQQSCFCLDRSQMHDVVAEQEREQ